MKREELRKEIIKIMEGKLSNYEPEWDEGHFILESEIPFIADDILGLHFADVVQSFEPVTNPYIDVGIFFNTKNFKGKDIEIYTKALQEYLDMNKWIICKAKH